MDEEILHEQHRIELDDQSYLGVLYNLFNIAHTSIRDPSVSAISFYIDEMTSRDLNTVLQKQ